MDSQYDGHAYLYRVPSAFDQGRKSTTSDTYSAAKNRLSGYVDGLYQGAVVYPRAPARPKILETTNPVNVFFLDPAFGTGAIPEITKRSNQGPEISPADNSQ